MGWVVQSKEGVGERSCGIDDSLEDSDQNSVLTRGRQSYFGPNIPFFSGKVIPETGSVQFTGTSLMEISDLAMVSDDCTMFDCSHNQRNIHARIIMLSYALIRTVNIETCSKFERCE